MTLDQRRIEALVERVVARLESEGAIPGREPGAPGRWGVCLDLDEAVDAAWRSHRHLMTLPLDTRREMIVGMRRAVRAASRLLAELAVKETGMGRVEDKIKKNLLVGERTPGVEALTPHAVTGDHGIMLTEFAPYGVVAAVTPSTNPSETVINNAIGMVAAGNGVVFAPHPAAAGVTNRTVQVLNEAIAAAGGPRELLASLAEPSIGLAQRLMRHRRVKLVVVTGGPAVVKEAMTSGKRVVAAGPGNPPVVVDETADIARAARDIVLGASLDNNIVCSDEKEVLVVSPVADALLSEMARSDAVLLTPRQTEQLCRMIFQETRGPRRHGVMDKRWVGKNASELMAGIGLTGDDRVRLLVAEVGVDHPLMWTEQLMPVMPVARVADVDTAIELAKAVEHGYGHTAVMHSRNIEKLSKMAREIDSCIFVKNGPAYAGLGYGGEGPTSFTIAHPTGDGMTDARTFSRLRRCTLVDSFRIV